MQTLARRGDQCARGAPIAVARPLEPWAYTGKAIVAARCECVRGLLTWMGRSSEVAGGRSLGQKGAASELVLRQDGKGGRVT